MLSIQHSGKEHVSETHTVLRDGQPPTVAFTVLAQVCGPKAIETEMGAVLFTKNGKGLTPIIALLLYRVVGCHMPLIVPLEQYS